MKDITHTDLTKVLQGLDTQHAQAIANVNAIDGARQLARQLLADMAKDEPAADSPLPISDDAKGFASEASPDADDGKAG